MAEIVSRKCPLCGGNMLKSKATAGLVWVKPWAGVFDLSTFRTRALPWACMNCGVVLFYLENAPALADEYRTRRQNAEVPDAAPSAIKP
jgi:hypothetical protein